MAPAVSDSAQATIRESEFARSAMTSTDLFLCMRSGSWGESALVGGLAVGVLDDLLGATADLLAGQVRVDLVVGHPVGVLVGEPGAQVLEVGGRHLLDQVRRRTQLPADVAHPGLGETEQRGDVERAVAVLG